MTVAITRPTKEWALEDTGVMAREVLGYDYDQDEDSGEITRPGGIYPYGPHQDAVEFLDAPEPHFKQLVMPRGSRKTSIVIARIVRRTCQNLNRTTAYCMQVAREAELRTGTIRDIFKHNQKINDWYGPDGKFEIKGGAGAWTIANRPDVALVDPTLKAGGLDRSITGSHPEDIYLDDLCDWLNVRNPEQIQKAIDYAVLCEPLRKAGGYVIQTATPYDESDVTHWIRDREKYASLWIDCGMEMVVSAEGKPCLNGTARFPHMNETFLQHKLDGMPPDMFSANYLLECMSKTDQLFFREQLIPARWEDWMHQLSGFMLTDTATTDAEYGCYSVLALVLLGHDDTAYLADLRIGLWKPEQFVSEFFDLWQHWHSRCRLHHATMESTSANQVFRSLLDGRARERQILYHLKTLVRGQNDQNKRRRIQALHPRFASRRFCVLDTVPRETVVLGKRLTLWDPEGFTASDGRRWPAGILVDQLIRPNSKKKDIPDALADIEAVDVNGNRICPPSPSPRWQVDSRPESVSRRHRPEEFWRRAAQRHPRSWGDLANRR